MKTKPRKLISTDESICIRCRGTKLLCGKPRCPILVKYYAARKNEELIDKNIYGSSPPSIFVGRHGYPKVSIGPMIPPLQGDTSYMDTPELWHDKSIDEIVDFRMKLIRGKHRVHVTNLNDKIAQYTQEIAMAYKPVEMEVEFEKKPSGHIALYDEVQPHGPAAKIKRLWLANPKVDRKVEKLYYDEVKAKEAILMLYNQNVFVSQIQKAFSAGIFGIEKKFVPTRWSITAVDSMIGDELVKEVKRQPLIDSIHVYYTKSLDNLWVVVMYPSSWEYELIEAWYPNTTWNPLGKKIVMFGDHEFYKGRKTYASIGGCYYAARMAAAEHLRRMRRQAGVVVLREIHPGYIMPVGVWNVRENVRRALKGNARKFDSLKEALLFVSSILFIPVRRWIETSVLLQNRIKQARLEDFYEMQKRAE